MCSLKFITIGFIEFHKGQDILIEAIKGLEENLLAECIFTIVGNKNSLFAEELEKIASGICCIKMIGTVDRKEIHRLLTDSDVLICPSREDSMPTVCAEAMMHKVPCIVSEATGTSKYITNQYDGLVFANEDVDDLRKKIIWCIKNKNKIHQMGEKAYSIYRKKFSMEAFKDNLLKHVHEMI